MEERSRKHQNHAKGYDDSENCFSLAAAGLSRQDPIDLTAPEPSYCPAQFSSLDGNPTHQDPINLTAPESSYAPVDASFSSCDPTCQGQCFSTPVKKRKAPGSTSSSPPSEKRLRAHRKFAPQRFHDVYQRALNQRFYVLQRSRGGTAECPEETFEMTGSTGNIYTVTIKQRPTCNCPHARAGNQCKHVIYILARVLQAPFKHVYQLALLSSELRDIFADAPDAHPTKDSDTGKRKAVDGDCPICFCAFVMDSPESVVWCRAACGQNIHQECFEMWAKTKTGNVTCPFCRSEWEGDLDMVCKVKKDRGNMNDGYVNVADQLGISKVRDETSYYSIRRRPRWYDRERTYRWNRLDGDYY